MKKTISNGIAVREVEAPRTDFRRWQWSNIELELLYDAIVFNRYTALQAMQAQGLTVKESWAFYRKFSNGTPYFNGYARMTDSEVLAMRACLSKSNFFAHGMHLSDPSKVAHYVHAAIRFEYNLNIKINMNLNEIR